MNDLKEKINSILASVYDPEIPVLSIIDLGIVRDITTENNAINIMITPTYSGCPAMDVISTSIRFALLEHGFTNCNIQLILSPAWSTDWITENGKKQLLAYGIAPPIGKQINEEYLENLSVPCPQCQSTNTALVSQFGSTACKALFKCLDCKEPFDYFKCH